MVVGLVFEKEQPVFFFAFHLDLDPYRAGVDLFGLIEFVHPAGFLERLHRQRSDIHQGYRLRTVQVLSRGKILVIGLLYQFILKADLVDDGVERRMAAVIRPVSIDHLDLGDRGIPVLFLKVALAEQDVVDIHGQTVFADKLLQLFFCKRAEAV